MILITHDLGVVAETCDKVAVMYAGEIVEYGTARDIFRSAGDHHPIHEWACSAPSPTWTRKTDRLHPIDGLMPDPTNLPDGMQIPAHAAPTARRSVQNRYPRSTYEEDGHRIFCNRFRKEGVTMRQHLVEIRLT